LLGGETTINDRCTESRRISDVGLAYLRRQRTVFEKNSDKL